MKKKNNRKVHSPILNLPSWQYFGQFYRGQYGRLTMSAVCAAAQSLVVLPSLYLIRYAFDRAIPENDISLLIWIGVGIFVFRLINLGISLWLRNVNIKIIQTAIYKLRKDLLEKLFQFSRSFYTQVDRNEMHAIIVQDTQRLNVMSDTVATQFIPALFTSMALCIVLLAFNWVLFLTLIATVPLLIIANRVASRKIKKKVFAFQRAFEAFSKGMMFVLRHMDLTRVQSNEAAETERQTENLSNLRSTNSKMSLVFCLHNQVQGALTSLAGVITIVVGGAAVGSGAMTLGKFLSFYFAVSLLSNRINTITASVPDIISGNESLNTLNRLAMSWDVRPYQGQKVISVEGNFTFDSVSFKYKEKPILNNFSLCLKPDSYTAIVGPNGSGKTTIIHLILGFYRPYAGCLYADGSPYQDIDIKNLRRSIGIVTQHPAMFPGTVLENITYGNSTLDKREVIRAAKNALADDFIQQLPEGYDTQIGEDGVLLSGGQCQRMAIARALLANPKLLILDEPTNHIDRLTVLRLMEVLKNMERRPAILVVSHDKDVYCQAEEIYELERGALRPYAEN